MIHLIATVTVMAHRAEIQCFCGKTTTTTRAGPWEDLQWKVTQNWRGHVWREKRRAGPGRIPGDDVKREDDDV